jgi:hypothetical protein
VWRGWAIVSGSIPGLMKVDLDRGAARKFASGFHRKAKVRAIPCKVIVETRHG